MTEPMQKYKMVCVFCSADDKVPEEYKQIAHQLGRTLAVNGLALLSGGNNCGLMNSINNGHAEVSPQIPRYAAIPEIMRPLAVHHPLIPHQNVMWSEDVHERLKIFHGMCDYVVILPGGYGTLHELMDCLVLSQFGVIKKHIFLLNIDNFWDPLLQQFERMVQKRALHAAHFEHLIVVQTIDELMSGLNSENALELHQGFNDEYWK